jgi:hypothetical protein
MKSINPYSFISEANIPPYPTVAKVVIMKYKEAM